MRKLMYIGSTVVVGYCTVVLGTFWRSMYCPLRFADILLPILKGYSLVDTLAAVDYSYMCFKTGPLMINWGILFPGMAQREFSSQLIGPQKNFPLRVSTTCSVCIAFHSLGFDISHEVICKRNHRPVDDNNRDNGQNWSTIHYHWLSYDSSCMRL